MRTVQRSSAPPNHNQQPLLGHAGSSRPTGPVEEAFFVDPADTAQLLNMESQ